MKAPQKPLRSLEKILTIFVSNRTNPYWSPCTPSPKSIHQVYYGHIKTKQNSAIFIHKKKKIYDWHLQINDFWNERFFMKKKITCLQMGHFHYSCLYLRSKGGWFFCEIFKHSSEIRGLCLMKCSRRNASKFAIFLE